MEEIKKQEETQANIKIDNTPIILEGTQPNVEEVNMEGTLDFSVSVSKKPKFEPLSAYHDLCLGTLTKVEVVERTINSVNAKGDESSYEFAGKTIPELKLTFENYKIAGIDEVDREFVKTYSPITWDNDADDKKQENIKGVYDGMNVQLIHLVQYFTSIIKNPAKPIVPIVNPSAPTDIRLEAFKKYFTGFANWFNTGRSGKPVYQDGNGKPIVLIIKLVAVTKSGNGGKQYKVLDFPRFVGEGFIEVFKSIKQIPGIKIKPGESVKLEKVVLGAQNNVGTADQSIVNADDLSPEVKRMMGITE